jgi:hypothetical protein
MIADDCLKLYQIQYVASQPHAAHLANQTQDQLKES